MKRMTVMLIALGLMMAIPALALAEDEGPGGPPGKGAMKKFRAMRLAELQEALNLDDKTMLKLNEVLKKNDDKRDALHKEAREGMRQLKDLMDAQKPDEAKITAALDKHPELHAKRPHGPCADLFATLDHGGWEARRIGEICGHAGGKRRFDLVGQAQDNGLAIGAEALHGHLNAFEKFLKQNSAI